jgi:site-specific DNA recombinase
MPSGFVANLLFLYLTAMPPASLPTVRVAIYARVSSEEQREGQTIASQIAELERFARAQGWLIAGIYKDEGWSGAVLARPELDRLRDDASKQLFDVVLLNDVDRLARDVSHIGVIKRDLERHGAQVRFRKLPAEQSPTANLMVNILGSFAEFEREMIIDRTRRGRRYKVEVRQLFLGSLAPYGYRYVTKDQSASRDGYLEILPEQATIVRQMFGWVDGEGLSARQVVRRLNELRIKPCKGGQAWAKSTVLRILRCEAYTGVWYYNKFESYAPTAGQGREYRRTTKYKLRQRPREEWIKVELPDQLRLIERAQWERVQAQLLRNLSFAERNSRHSYLLRGLVQCGGCGARYVGDPNHGKFYYRCHRRCKQYPTVREEVLDQTVWDAITELILNPELVVEQIAQREQDAAAKATQSATEIKEVEQGLATIDEEERRILEAYRLGVLTPAILGRELEQLKVRRATLLQRQGELNAQRQQPPLAVIRRTIFDYCREVAQRLAAFTEAERQRLLQMLIEVVIFKGDRVTIKGFIPPPNAPTPQMKETGNAQEQANFSLADGIAPTETYSRSHNSVNQITFEIAKSLPKLRPLWTEERLRVVRRLIKRKPNAKLRELCEWVRVEQGISVSISNMSRALRKL